ncbi:MAG: oligosaccharide flippase family protein [Elusimicrobia bacterium]|nr:oligosaccharide flippase family protein [Elusimicrobiota bacterium]
MSTFVKNSFWTIFSQGVIFIFGMGISVLISRFLSPEGRGLYTLALFLPGFLLYFFSPGIGVAATYYISNGKYSPKTVLGNSMVCVVLHSVIAIVAGIVLINFTRDRLFEGVSIRHLYLTLLILPSQFFMTFVFPIFLGMNKIREYNIFQVIHYALLFGMLILFFVGFHTGVAGAIAVEAMAGFLTCVVAIFIISKETKGFSFKIDKTYIKAAYNYGMKMYVGNLFSFLNRRLNLLIINNYLSATAVGFFGLSQGLSEKVWVVADAIGSVLFPRIASESNKDKKDLYTALVFKVTILVIGIVSIFLCVLGKALIVFLYSPVFMESVAPFRYLLIGVVAGSGWRILENDLRARGKPGFILCIIVISLIVSVLLNFILIPRWGMTGAVSASVFSSMIGLVASVLAFNFVSGGKGHLLFWVSRSDLIFFKNTIRTFLR